MGWELKYDFSKNVSGVFIYNLFDQVEETMESRNSEKCKCGQHPNSDMISKFCNMCGTSLVTKHKNVKYKCNIRKGTINYKLENKQDYCGRNVLRPVNIICDFSYNIFNEDRSKLSLITEPLNVVETFFKNDDDFYERVHYIDLQINDNETKIEFNARRKRLTELFEDAEFTKRQIFTERWYYDDWY
jgi:hypothetical protein